MTTYYQKYQKYQQRYHQLAGTKFDEVLNRLNHQCGDLRDKSNAELRQQWARLNPELESIPEMRPILARYNLSTITQHHKLCTELIQTLQSLKSGLKPREMRAPRDLREDVMGYLEGTIFPQLIYHQETDSESSLEDDDWGSLGTPTTEVLPKIFDYLGHMDNEAHRPTVLDAPLDQTVLVDPQRSVFNLTPAENSILELFKESVTREFRGPDKRRYLVTLLNRYIKKYQRGEPQDPSQGTIALHAFKGSTDYTRWNAPRPIVTREGQVIPSVRTLKGFRMAVKLWLSLDTQELPVPRIRCPDAHSGMTSPEEQLLDTSEESLGWMDRLRGLYGT